MKPSTARWLSLCFSWATGAQTLPVRNNSWRLTIHPCAATQSEQRQSKPAFATFFQQCVHMCFDNYCEVMYCVLYLCTPGSQLLPELTFSPLHITIKLAIQCRLNGMLDTFWRHTSCMINTKFQHFFLFK